MKRFSCFLLLVICWLPIFAATTNSYPMEFVVVKQGLKMSSADVLSAAVIPNGKGCYGIQWTLNKQSAKQLTNMTAANKKQLMMVIVNGQVLNLARVESALGAKTQLKGCYSKQQATEIVQAITATKKA